MLSSLVHVECMGVMSLHAEVTAVIPPLLGNMQHSASATVYSHRTTYYYSEIWVVYLMAKTDTCRIHVLKTTKVYGEAM